MAESKLDFKTSIRKVFYKTQSTINAGMDGNCSENVFKEQFSNDISDGRINNGELRIAEQSIFGYEQNGSVDKVAPISEDLESLHFDESSSVSSETLFIRECEALKNSSSSTSLYSHKFSGAAPPTWNRAFKKILGAEQTIAEVEIKPPNTETAEVEDTIFYGLARGRVTGPDPRNDIENQSFHDNYCLPRARGPRFGRRNNFRGPGKRSFVRFEQRNSMKEDNCSKNQSLTGRHQFDQKNNFKEDDSSKKQNSARARGFQKRQSYGSSTRIWRGKKVYSPNYLTDREYEEIKKIEQTLRAAQTFKLPKQTLTLNDFDGAGVNCFKKEFEMPPVVPKKPPKHSFKYEVHGRIYYFQSDSDEELDYASKLKPNELDHASKLKPNELDHASKLKPNEDVKHEGKKRDYFKEQKKLLPIEPTEYWDDDPVIMTKS